MSVHDLHSSFFDGNPHFAQYLGSPRVNTQLLPNIQSLEEMELRQKYAKNRFTLHFLGSPELESGILFPFNIREFRLTYQRLSVRDYLHQSWKNNPDFCYLTSGMLFY